MFLRLVHLLDGGDQLQWLTRLRRDTLQCLHVLWEAGAAEAGARVQELVADARIGADAAAHLLDVGAERLGQVGHFVHEGDARGEHRVGGVLGELGRAHAHHDDALAVPLERRVEAPQHGDGPLIVRADDDAVGAHEVLDRGAFLEEFRVRDDGEIAAEMALLLLLDDRLLHLVGGADRHGGLRHHHLVALHVAADGARGGDHVLQIGRAVLARRGAHREKLQLAVRHARGDVGREAQPPGLLVALHDGLEAWLEDRNFSAVQAGDLVLVQVEAEDVVAGVREAGARDQADIAGTDDGYVHGVSSNSSVRRGG